MEAKQSQNGEVVEKPEKPIISVGDVFESPHSEYQVSKIWITENTTPIVRLMRDDNARVTKYAEELQKKVVEGDWKKVSEE